MGRLHIHLYLQVRKVTRYYLEEGVIQEDRWEFVVVLVVCVSMRKERKDAE